MTPPSGRNLRDRKTNKDQQSKVTRPKKPATTESTRTSIVNVNRLSSSSSNISKLTSSSTSTTATSSNRLSSATTTTGSRPLTPAAQNPNIRDSVLSLEKRVVSLETIVTRLTLENTDLRQAVADLRAELTQCKDRFEQVQTPASPVENNSSSEQQSLNSNIVIRGVDITENSTSEELHAVFNGLRNHLNVSEIDEIAPVSVSLLPSNSTRISSSARPILVQFQSVSAKIKFLQIRRAKKDILQSDIGINSTSRRPILISEQLTRANQELLYQARSLRGQNSFKFVWSTNGQVLARLKENTKVIRIIDFEHVNRLRSDFNLEPLPHHGQLYARNAV